MKKQNKKKFFSMAAILIALSLFLQPMAALAAERLSTYPMQTSPSLTAGHSDIAGSAFIDKDGRFYWLYSYAGYGRLEQNEDGSWKIPSDSWTKHNTNTDMGALNTNWGTATTAVTHWNVPGSIGYRINEQYNIPSPYMDDHNDPIGVWVDPETGYWYALVNDEYQFSPFDPDTSTTIAGINRRVGSGIHNNRILSAYSTDKGKTWKLIGQVATSPYNGANEEANGTIFPGETWSYGVAGCRMFVDNVNGYIYALYNNHVNVKPGYSNILTWFHLARSPISAKMADGSWDVWSPEHGWTKSALKGYAGWIGSPMGAGNNNALSVNYKQETDELILKGKGLDNSDLSIKYFKMPAGDITFKDTAGNTYTVNLTSGTIKNAGGTVLTEPVTYIDPALGARITAEVILNTDKKLRFKITQENISTGHIAEVDMGAGNPLFKDMNTQRLFVPVNTQYENAFSYNVYTGKYMSVGYDGYVYETDDLGDPNSFRVIGKLPDTAGAYVTNLDPGSLTNQQVSSYSFRMISDLTGRQYNYSLAASEEVSNKPVYNPPKDSNGDAISPSQAYTVSIGGEMLNDGTDNDKWQFVPVPDLYDSSKNSGFYRIQNIATGEYLKVSGDTVEKTRAIGSELTYGTADKDADPNGNRGNGAACGSDQWYLLPIGNSTPKTLNTQTNTFGQKYNQNTTQDDIDKACDTSVAGVATYRLVNRTSAFAAEFVDGKTTLQHPAFGSDNPQALTITPVEEVNALPIPALTAKAASGSRINVSWDVLEGLAYDMLVDNEIIENVTSPYAHRELDEDSNHIYQVRAKNSDGKISLWSLPLKAKTKSYLISQGKPATASSYQAGNEIRYANDGSEGTRWAAADAAVPQWWKVDLGKEYYINRLESSWFNSSYKRSYQYEIWGSSNDKSYKLIVDKNDNTTQDKTVDEFSAVARYVMIKVTGVKGDISSAAASAFEFKIYGEDKTPLTIEGQGVDSKVYDGTAAADIKPEKLTLTGVKPGDDVKLDFSEAVASFSDKNFGIGKTVTISDILLTGNNAEDYVIDSTYVTRADITAKPVHVTGITAESKSYDGTVIATLVKDAAALTEADIIENDEVSLDATKTVGLFEDEKAGRGKTVMVTGLALTGKDAGNYVLAEYTTTADIHAQQAGTVIVKGIIVSDKVYDGTTSAQINTDQVELIGIDETDKGKVSLVTAGAAGNFADKNAGEDKTVIVTGLTLTGEAAEKYTLGPCTAVAGIIPKAVSVSGIAAHDKKQDGSADATLNTDNAVLDGVLAEDRVVLDSTGAQGAFNHAEPGVGKPVMVTGLTLRGPDEKNYRLEEYVTTANILIGVDVEGIQALDKVYDGTTNASLNTSAAKLNGVAVGDTVKLDISKAVGVFEDKYAGDAKIVDIEGLALSGKDAGKYILNPYTTRAKIDKKPLEVTGVIAENKDFDGAVAAVVNTAGATISAGIIPGDSVTLNKEGVTGKFENEVIGWGKVVEVTGFTIEGPDAVNYEFSGNCTVRADITAPKNLINRVQGGIATVTATDYDKAGEEIENAIDGKTNTRWTAKPGFPKELTIDLGGIYNFEKVAVLWFNGGSASRAYNYRIEVSSDNQNYTKVAEKSGLPIPGNAGTAVQREDKFSAVDARYVKITVTGVNGSGQASIFEVQVLGEDASTPKLTVEGITAKSKVYDGTTVVDLDVTNAKLAGMQPGEDITLDVSNVSGYFEDKNAGTGKNVIITGLKVGGADANKYPLPFAATTADITKKPVNVVGIIASDKIYDGNTDADINTNGIVLDGVIPGDVVSANAAEAKGVFESKDAGNGKRVMVNGLTLTGAGAANYELKADAAATADIAPKAISVTGITAANKIYDGNTEAVIDTSNTTMSGILLDDDVTLDVSAAKGTFDSADAGEGKTVTVTGLNLTGADAGNYILGAYTTTAGIREDDSANIIIGLETVNVKTTVGTAPRLPETVTATYTDDSTASVAVQWETIDPDKYAAAGSFEVQGTVSNTTLSAIAVVTVEESDPEQPIEIVALETVNVKTTVGTAPSLPEMVTATYTDSSTASVPVQWETIEPNKYAAAGSFEVQGIVSNTTLSAIAVVTVETGTGGSIETPPAPPVPAPDPVTVDKDKITIDVKPDANGTVTATLKGSDLNKAVENAKDGKVIIEIQLPEGAKEVKLNLPLKEIAEAGATGKIDGIKVNMGLVTVTISPEMMKNIGTAVSSELQLSVSMADTSDLSETVKQQLNGSAVYGLSLRAGNVDITGSKEKEVSVEIPYTLKPGQDPNKVIIYHINDSGTLEIVKNGKYNAKTGRVTFNSARFGEYAAAYSDISFKDLSGAAWAKTSIETLAARGIISGVGDNLYAPNRNVTRAEFLTILMNAFDLTDENAECTFTDVETGNWYYNTIATAQKLGIVSGKGNGFFGVNETISRQDMAVMVYKVSKLLIIDMDSSNDLPEFADSSDIAAYAADAVNAMQKTGIISGIGKNRFAPQNHATRAEAATIIYKIFTMTE